jgi:hypothetical protein
MILVTYLSLYSSYLLIFQPNDPVAIELRLAGMKLAGLPTDSTTGVIELLAALLWPEAPPLQAVSAIQHGGASLPPDLDNTVFALTYGRKNGWGSLREATTGGQAVTMAAEFAGQVQGHTTKRVVPLVNPVIREKFHGRYDATGDPWLQEIITLAALHQVYVMLDIQLGSGCVEQGKQIIADYAQYEHVWFDVDIEHSCGGTMHANQLDELAAYFNTLRVARGYQRPALFGFWYFQPGSVIGQPRKQHGDVLVVTMFDGYQSNGDLENKIRLGHQRLLEMGDGPAGVMWFPKHDGNITLAEVMQGFPHVLIVARQ